MKTLSRNQSLAAAFLAAVTFGLPAAASAQSYSQTGYNYVQCKKSDKDNQIVGGIIGAITGSVVGSQVSGNGARTEGSVLGALVGAAAGAAIADDKRNCRKEAQVISGRTYSGSTAYRSSYSQPRTYSSTTYGSGYTQPRNQYSTTTYRPVPSYGHSGYTTVDNRRRPGQNAANRLDNVQFRIDNLRSERRQLESRQRRHYSHHRAQKISDIGQQLDRLKSRKRNLKQVVRNSRRR